MSPGKKPRAIADGVSGIGVHRYGLYRAAWARVEEAATAGYYLEAITILESLLADRMESRASHLTGKNEGFQTLGQLITLFRKHEREDGFLVSIDRIDAWRLRRNKALHEMVKFAQGEFPTWGQQVAELPDVVREGKSCLLEFDALDEAARVRNGRHAATWPNAFGTVENAGSTPAANPANLLERLADLARRIGVYLREHCAVGNDH